MCAVLLWRIWVNARDANENERLENHIGIWPPVLHWRGGVHEDILQQSFGLCGITSPRLRRLRVFTWFKIFPVSHLYWKYFLANAVTDYSFEIRFVMKFRKQVSSITVSYAVP